MSSACVCHTDEWCFYCNMYSPLERKYAEQNIAIERVIAELEQLVQHAEKKAGVFKQKESRMFGLGRVSGLTRAIDKLKAVIADDTTSNTPQIRSQENNR